MTFSKKGLYISIHISDKIRGLFKGRLHLIIFKLRALGQMKGSLNSPTFLFYFYIFILFVSQSYGQFEIFNMRLIYSFVSVVKCSVFLQNRKSRNFFSVGLHSLFRLHCK